MKTQHKTTTTTTKPMKISSVFLTGQLGCIEIQSRNSTGPEPEHSFHRSRNSDTDGGPQSKSSQQNQVRVFSMPREKQIGFSLDFKYQDTIAWDHWDVFVGTLKSSWTAQIHHRQSSTMFMSTEFSEADLVPRQLHASLIKWVLPTVQLVCTSFLKPKMILMKNWQWNRSRTWGVNKEWVKHAAKL